MEKAYWLRRKRASLKCAENAASSAARLTHYDLAGRYSLKALNAKSPQFPDTGNLLKVVTALAATDSKDLRGSGEGWATRAALMQCFENRADLARRATPESAELPSRTNAPARGES